MKERKTVFEAFKYNEKGISFSLNTRYKVLILLVTMLFNNRLAYSFLSSFSKKSHITKNFQIKNKPIFTKLPFLHRSFLHYSNKEEETTSSSTETEVKIPRKFVDVPFHYHQELTLRVSSLTNLGLGICRTNITNNSTDKQWVIMVPNVIPEELIKCRIYRNHKTYSDADLIEVIEPNSQHRVQPKCPISQTCGGCQYQHITTDFQRIWKQMQVFDLFQRIANLTLVNISNNNPNNATDLRIHPTLGTQETFHYRSKITPHYDAPRNNDDEIKIGFQQKQSRQIVDVPYCHIATHDINKKLAIARENITQQLLQQRESDSHLQQQNKKKKKRKGATLLFRHANEGVITNHKEYITTTVLSKHFRYLAGNFFQTNDYMLPVMVQRTFDFVKQKPNLKNFVDCYCGSGLFTLSAASYFQTCIGIEVNAQAIEEANYNAQVLNNLTNCHFVAASAEHIFSHELVKSFHRTETVVMLDPPRKGASIDFLMQLCQYQPEYILYMSCDPATQARDVKIILQESEGMYLVTDVQPFDLFPQTRHIESLAVLKRINKVRKGNEEEKGQERQK